MSVAEANPVSEHLYEGMFLVDSARFASEPEETTAEILKVLERAGATIVAHRPWQDGKLAYEIQGRRKGLHYIVCFRMPGSGMDVVTRQVRLSEIVLRHIVINHPPELFNAMVQAITGETGEGEDEERETEAAGSTEEVEAGEGAPESSESEEL